ncbi:hypothetical protein THAOC_35921 [Thalassiosira oceanica]|uniref:Uncharacterized protein n=1 Tax=Thalassiosira oceanica TaxID=159749 RepID=K0R069_THAOC|nr:hypothetical protein THAOC_35921 [Thalassiosira oceanica]|eukprot:EJK45463.1 hypothetical protein THAOC_35921 [Thalassiosira oceanica]
MTRSTLPIKCSAATCRDDVAEVAAFPAYWTRATIHKATTATAGQAHSIFLGPRPRLEGVHIYRAVLVKDEEPVFSRKKTANNLGGRTLFVSAVNFVCFAYRRPFTYSLSIIKRYAASRRANLIANVNKLDIGDYCPFISHHLLYDPVIAPADVEALAEHRDPPTASPLYHNNMIFDRSFINTLVQRTGFECDGTSELHELSRRHVKLLNMTEYFPCEKGGGTYLDYELRELMTLLRPSTEVVTGEDGRRYKVKATTLHLEVRPSEFCFTTQMLLVKVQGACSSARTFVEPIIAHFILDEEDRALYNPAVLVCKQNDSNHIQADLQLGDIALERSHGSASDRSIATPMIAEDQEKTSHKFEVYYFSGNDYTTKHFNKFDQKVARCHLKPEYYMVGRDGRLTYELCDAHRGYPMVMVHDSSSPAVPIGREQLPSSHGPQSQGITPAPSADRSTNTTAPSAMTSTAASRASTTPPARSDHG